MTRAVTPCSSASRARGLEAEPQAVRVGDEQEVGVAIGLAVDADLAGQQELRAAAGRSVSQPPSPSAWRSFSWYSAIGSRKTTTRPSSAAIATAPRSMRAASSPRDGTASTRPGMSRRAPMLLSLWKWPPKPFWYARPGHAHDHRVAELAGAEELERGRLAAQLVERVVQVGEVLDLRDRQQADVGRALGDAEDARLVEQRVEDAGRAEALLEAVGDVVDAALAADVLAEHEELGAPQQLVGERGVQAAGQGAGGRRAGGLRQRRAERAARSSARRPACERARGPARGGTAPAAP